MLNAVRNPNSISTTGLASSAFAHHYSQNLVWFLFLALLRCFSSGGSPHIPMDSVYDTWVWTQVDCSIQKSTDQSLFAAPRGLSQLITSFIGSWCQGIRPAPFVAWPIMLVLTIVVFVTLAFAIVILYSHSQFHISLFNFQGTIRIFPLFTQQNYSHFSKSDKIGPWKLNNIKLLALLTGLWFLRTMSP